MSYILQYSPTAKSDFVRIYYEVFQTSLDNNMTKQYVKELVQKIKDKVDFPESGTPLNFNNIFTGYRYVIYKSYIAFYTIDGNNMKVNRILYAKSDYLKILHIK